MGYKLAGCDVILANDIDARVKANYVANLNPRHYKLCPISDLINDSDTIKLLQNIDILDGSPPCTPFSMAGDREKNWGVEKHFAEGSSKQVLDDLFFKFIELTDAVRPKAIITENVKGLIIGKARGYAKLIIAKLRAIGYAPQIFLINANKCNVPQSRERVFIVAIRNDLFKRKLKLIPNAPVITAAQAFATLPPQKTTHRHLKGIRVNLWVQSKPGQYFSEHFEKKAAWFGHHKIKHNAPCSTLTTRCDQKYHWAIPRKLTIPELTRIASFPDDYEFITPPQPQYLLGMSVPPRMMQFVASEVIKQWF